MTLDSKGGDQKVHHWKLLV